jgi:2-iminobutanoate/2-iminopropanoate deaminase
MNPSSSLIALALFTNLAFCSSPIGFANAQDSGKKVILSPSAPIRLVPYSQAIEVGNTVYLSGQAAINPKSNQPMANASIEDQTRRTLDNLKAVLEADGLTMNNIVSTTVFLKDINEFGKMNEVYATYFKEPPARATVEVAQRRIRPQIRRALLADIPAQSLGVFGDRDRMAKTRLRGFTPWLPAEWCRFLPPGS